MSSLENEAPVSLEETDEPLLPTNEIADNEDRSKVPLISANEDTDNEDRSKVSSHGTTNGDCSHIGKRRSREISPDPSLRVRQQYPPSLIVR